MSLVKIARIDLFLSMTQSHNSQSFVSFTYNTGWQIIDIQANSTNYSILSLSFSLSLFYSYPGQFISAFSLDRQWSQ